MDLHSRRSTHTVHSNGQIGNLEFGSDLDLHQFTSDKCHDSKSLPSGKLHVAEQHTWKNHEGYISNDVQCSDSLEQCSLK